jgi:hypothetical protein
MSFITKRVGYNFLHTISEFIKKNPRLEELYLDMTLPDHPFCDLNGTYYDSDNKIGTDGRCLGSTVNMWESKSWDPISTYTESQLIPALKESKTLKKFTWVKQPVPPKGSVATQLDRTGYGPYGYTYRLVPKPTHHEWDALMTLLPTIRTSNKNLEVIIR